MSEIALNQVGMKVTSRSSVLQLTFSPPDICTGIAFTATNLYLLIFKSINMDVVFLLCMHCMGTANSLSSQGSEEDLLSAGIQDNV